jgi:hypothetical protein
MSGHWEEVRSEVWDTVVTPCDCCGQVVAGRQWVVEVPGEGRRRFCDATCEDLYRTHVLARRARE